MSHSSPACSPTNIADQGMECVATTRSPMKTSQEYQCNEGLTENMRKNGRREYRLEPGEAMTKKGMLGHQLGRRKGRGCGWEAMRRQKVAVRQCKSLKLSNTTVHTLLQAVYTDYSRVGAQGCGYFNEPLRTQNCMPARSERKITCYMLCQYKYNQRDFNRGVS